MKKKTQELLKQALQALHLQTEEWLDKNDKYCQMHGFFDENDGCFYPENIEKSDAPEFVKIYFRLKNAGIITAIYPFMIDLR